MAKRKPKKTIETITHDEAARKNIPTAEYQSVMREEEESPIRLAYERRNRDLDPQLVWRGKDQQDWSDLVVHAPPLYIQEKVHPKVLIDDLVRQTEKQESEDKHQQMDLFADFNGLPDEKFRTEFYQHDANWTNRMILGDSLQVMASLAEREGLRGKVQCIYIDPPYGIKFNSNFQWSTTSRDVKDGKVDHITREPEQVKAFRDTWRDGIHSYLTYLRDRLVVSRDLLSNSGTIFLQIGIENAHRVRALMDEVFGDTNHLASIVFRKTTGKAGAGLDNTYDVAVWYAKNIETAKIRRLFFRRNSDEDQNFRYDFTPAGTFEFAGERPSRIARMNPITSQSASETTIFEYPFMGKTFKPGKGGWKTNISGMNRLKKAQRLTFSGKTLGFVRPFDDFPYQTYNDIWDDTRQSGFGDKKIYVVQTGTKVIERCVLMSTDPGDLILDPTCGSGTTAHVAEQWGRRWITIDTSRVALALSRARIMGIRYPYYILADSREGQLKEAELSGTEPFEAKTHKNIRQGFTCERAPHIMLKHIANNSEIDVIWDDFQETFNQLLKKINKALGKDWADWQVPKEPGEPWPKKATRYWGIIQKANTKRKKLNALKIVNSELSRKYTLDDLPENPYDTWNNENAIELHAKWWEYRTARQKRIDISNAINSDFEYLYDKPYEDKMKVRVAGPFTVESLSPHRVLAVDEDDELIDEIAASQDGYGEKEHFVRMILENLKAAGVQQAHKEDKINFTSIMPWPGELVCAEGRFVEGDSGGGTEKRAAIFIGPEFGTVSRPDLVAAAREAGDAGFDALIACAFNYDAHSSEFKKLGRIPILKARMNADLHMADDLKNTGKGNLFVIFGEPDIDILNTGDDNIQVKINGVDVFHPQTGEVRSDGPEGIACWFIDTDYNEESFFVRHAYFLGANDPYKSLKTTLKAEIDKDAWESLHSDTSRPFKKPESGRIAVKVINHLGDEVMKVFRVN